VSPSARDASLGSAWWAPPHLSSSLSFSATHTRGNQLRRHPHTHEQTNRAAAARWPASPQPPSFDRPPRRLLLPGLLDGIRAAAFSPGSWPASAPLRHSKQPRPLQLAGRRGPCSSRAIDSLRRVPLDPPPRPWISRRRAFVSAWSRSSWRWSCPPVGEHVEGAGGTEDLFCGVATIFMFFCYYSILFLLPCLR
jgi:hypothetical protein